MNEQRRETYREVGTLVEDTAVVVCLRDETIGKHSTVGAKNAPSEPPLRVGA